ncbi:OmpP1/FadL family transporter [Marinimicrobium sp. ABcell2]|uniref:OmpP1/FadL family transporter n=1 Tax=Marinimicrobium sp. ABcell2 TaxID=3069751 RepID=UPI0027B01180|nr:OmpP1/FadL family transporter [Marinimicrobium sp. ABcell2]MDQ2076846.1 OmpP1/FadL family transporter [Marinimicrobium sp. ABcell2]
MSNKAIERKKRFRKKVLYGAVTSAILVAPLTHASSFYLLEQSPAHLGHAFAGTASNIGDASTVYFNPAGMTQLEGRQLTGGLNWVRPSSRFTDGGSNTGDVGSRTNESAVIPNLYYTHRLNEQWSFGLGLSVPFGLSSDWGDEWSGRYLATFSELEVLNFNATAAFAVNEQLSVGFGINYQTMDVTLQSQVDSTLGTNPSPGSDSYGQITGDADDVTFDLSVYYQLDDATAFGLTWRQGGTFGLTGRANFSRNAFCEPGAGAPVGETGATTGTLCAQALDQLEGNVRADVTLPDILTFSASHRFNNDWSFHADVSWTQWSSIQYVDVVNNETNSLVETLDLEYSDTFRAALGATYHMDGPWTLRAGIARDHAPQTSPTRMTPRIPDEDRTWLSAGFNYAHSEELTFDAGYAHLFIGDADIANLDPDTGNNVVGSFSSNVNIFSAQVNWRF